MSEHLLQQREHLRSVTRALENFRKIGQSNLTPAKLRSRIAALKETWAKCVQSHALLLELFSEKEDRAKHDYFKTKPMDEHEQLYLEALDYMAERLEELASPLRAAFNETSFVRSDQSALSLRHLPPIKLLPFSGEFTEWESFRDRFTALIIENKDLTNFSRMHFLASSLTGSARDAISGIPVTSDNFQVAWTALKDRYENKQKLIETHITLLINLTPMPRESAVELYVLRDAAMKSVTALKCLGRTSDEILNDILIQFVAAKLDHATCRAWKLKCSNSEDPFDFDDFMKFLSSRAAVLEELFPAAARTTKGVKVHNVTTLNSSEPKCGLCSGAHYLNKCEVFLGRSPSQRRAFIFDSKRCLNCLRTAHSADTCRSPYSCRKCQQRHNTLLHVDSSSQSDAGATSAISHVASSRAAAESQESAECKSPSSAIVMSSITIAPEPEPVLFATAKIIVEAPNGRKQVVRTLLDPGSEVTFITENLAQELRVPRARTLTRVSAVGGSIVGTCKHVTQFEFYSRGKPHPRFMTKAFILSPITKYCPPVKQRIDRLKHFDCLWLADDNPTSSAPIDMLIGANVYGRVILGGVRKGAPEQSIAQDSHLGWLISGPLEGSAASSNVIRAFRCFLEPDLKRLWKNFPQNGFSPPMSSGARSISQPRTLAPPKVDTSFDSHLTGALQLTLENQDRLPCAA